MLQSIIKPRNGREVLEGVRIIIRKGREVLRAIEREGKASKRTEQLME